MLALESDAANGKAINIGSGEILTVKQIGESICKALKTDLQPEILGKFRVGDIRHCFADITLAKELLGYQPKVKFSDGILGLAEWVSKQIALDKVKQSNEELTKRSLLK